MKKIIIIISLSLFLLATPSFATNPGPYIGLELGWGDVNQGSFVASSFNKAIQEAYPNDAITSVHMNFMDVGRGGRIFLGYQFNRFFAAEFGYYQFSNLNFNATISADVTVFDEYYPVYAKSNLKVETNAFDVIFKGIIPFTDYFSVFAKLGVAAIQSKVDAQVTIETPYIHPSVDINPSVNIVYPEFGLGFNYDITPKVSATLSVTRIQKINPCQYPSIDFASVGLLYRF